MSALAVQVRINIAKILFLLLFLAIGPSSTITFEAIVVTISVIIAVIVASVASVIVIALCCFRIKKNVADSTRVDHYPRVELQDNAVTMATPFETSDHFNQHLNITSNMAYGQEHFNKEPIYEEIEEIYDKTDGDKDDDYI